MDKAKKTAATILFVLTDLLAVSLFGCTSTGSAEKKSKPFAYSGYSRSEYKDYSKKSQFVEMSDGCKLAVDIYIPQKGPSQRAFPVIFQYTPYGRAYILKGLTKEDRVSLKNETGTEGPVFDRANSSNILYGSNSEMVRSFLAHGYVYICADMRGSGASFGHRRDFMPRLADDGYELITWICSQSWCSGKIGMFGGSYLGYSQMITAGKKPAGLQCIIPEVVPLDGYTGEIRPGAVFLWAYSQLDVQGDMELNKYMPDDNVFPTAPVIDEDGDGCLDDEIPIDKNRNGTFLDDYAYPENPQDEPQYEDGHKRKHIYYLATHEHLKNMPYSQIGPKATYIDTKIGKDDDGNGGALSSYEEGVAHNLKSIMESGIAIYNHGSWMDPFVRGSVELFDTLKNTNPSKLIIDPGYHEGTSPYWNYCGENQKSSLAEYTQEWLRFFDRYLKGIQNGIDTEAPVYIYNMNGDGWRAEQEWPLARQQLTEYYFSSSYTLQTSQSSEGKDTYKTDFQHDSRWETADGNKVSRWVMASPDVLPIRTEIDKHCLVYTSSPAEKDTEVTGHPIVNLWVSSSADNGDFFVYLEDVDENGKAVLVTENVLQAGFHNLYDNNTMICGGKDGINVLPKLPWHGFEEKQYEPHVLANNKIVQLQLDLLPTSWTFKKGHSIRVAIAASDWPTFEILPELSRTNKPDDVSNVTPVITIYHDKDHPSGIILPIIPRS